MSGWSIDGDLVRNPSGRPVLLFLEPLPSVVRQEAIERIIDGPEKAYRRGLEEGAEKGDIELDPPDDE